MMLVLYLTLLFSPLCANPCVLYSQGEADCSGRGLLYIPRLLPRDIRSLDLSCNLVNISQPFHEIFPQLLSLNLSKNPLHLLTDGTFLKMPNLQTLDLSNCNISMLSPNTFQGLDKLQTLILQNNRLHTLHLRNLKVLTYLDLRETLIISDDHQKLRTDFLKQLSSRRLCDCSSGEFVQKLDQHVSGLFCSCRAQLKGKDPLFRNSWYGFQKRFVRDVTEASLNITSHNLTSPSPTSSGSNGSTLPILLGFLLTAICLSLLIALAAKCQLFHKFVRSYHHRPLPEEDWMNHSQGDLPGVPLPNTDDEDGFIEDNYIQPGDHRNEDESENEHVEEDEEDNQVNLYTI